MEFNKLVFGSLALGCLIAAAAGGYLATRLGQTAQPEAAFAAPAESGTPAATTADAPRAVAESEGVIAPETNAAPAATAPASSYRIETSRRESSPRPVRPERVEGVRPARPAPAPSPVTVTPASRSARVDTSTSSAPASSGGTMWEARPSMEPERPNVSSEPEPPPPPPAPEFVELVIPADAVLGLQIDRTVSSELARVEDRVDARVTRDVRVGDRVAIPAGAVVQGSVMEVERGGKVKERAKLGIRFHTVVLADGTRLNIKTESIVREGASPSKGSAARIGGAAAGGAILGAILGGGKGAVIGGSIGAAGGTAATMAGDRQPAVLPAGSTVSVRVQQPVTVTVEK
jgi:hypothetical protein